MQILFYVFNKKEKKYLTIQGLVVLPDFSVITKEMSFPSLSEMVWPFSAMKTMWGFSRVLPLVTFYVNFSDISYFWQLIIGSVSSVSLVA